MKEMSLRRHLLRCEFDLDWSAGVVVDEAHRTDGVAVAGLIESSVVAEPMEWPVGD